MQPNNSTKRQDNSTASEPTTQEYHTFLLLLLEEIDTIFQLLLIKKTLISKTYKNKEIISNGDMWLDLFSLELLLLNFRKENTQLVLSPEDQCQLPKLSNLVIMSLFFYSLEFSGGNLRKVQELEDSTWPAIQKTEYQNMNLFKLFS